VCFYLIERWVFDFKVDAKHRKNLERPNVEKKTNFDWLTDWLIDYLSFYVPLKNFSLIWRRPHWRWRATKCRPMLGAQGLWTGGNHYCATPTVTRDVGLIWSHPKDHPFSRLIWHTRGCEGPILTRILTGDNFLEFASLGYKLHI
jgi:hypothetical protein